MLRWLISQFDVIRWNVQEHCGECGWIDCGGCSGQLEHWSVYEKSFADAEHVAIELILQAAEEICDDESDVTICYEGVDGSTQLTGFVNGDQVRLWYTITRELI